MADNPFQPPKSGFDNPPRDREPGSLYKAVLFGALTDIGGTELVGIVLSIVYTVVMALQGQSTEQIQASLTDVTPLSPLGLLGMFCGLTMSVVGGFVCARTANVSSYTAVGILSAISVAYGAFNGVGEHEWTTLLLLNLLSLAANFVGGWLCIRKLVAQP